MGLGQVVPEGGLLYHTGCIKSGQLPHKGVREQSWQTSKEKSITGEGTESAQWKYAWNVQGIARKPKWLDGKGRNSRRLNSFLQCGGQVIEGCWIIVRALAFTE